MTWLGRSLGRRNKNDQVDAVLDKVGEAQRVQRQLGQVRDDVGIMAASFAITITVAVSVGDLRAVGGRGVVWALQR
jgi:hypothetical protein